MTLDETVSKLSQIFSEKNLFHTQRKRLNRAKKIIQILSLTPISLM